MQHKLKHFKQYSFYDTFIIIYNWSTVEGRSCEIQGQLDN